MTGTINIVSKSLNKSSGGPPKRIQNAIKGLRKIGQDYVLNQPVTIHRYNWIQDDPYKVIELSKIRKPAVIGPNLFVLPKDIPSYFFPLDHFLYLQSSQWTIDLWKELGFKECRLVPWACGIDTDRYFSPLRNASNRMLLYFKHQPLEKQKTVIKTVRNMGLIPTILEYGYYNEIQFLEALHNSSFGIWIGTTESQGFALMEALASNLPLLVVDNNNVLDNTSLMVHDLPQSLSSFKATSVPYFNQQCGIVLDSLDDLSSGIKQMLQSHGNFEPAKFITDNYSLEKGASQLVDYIKSLPEPGMYSRNPVINIQITALQKIFFLRKQRKKIRRRLLRLLS